MVQSWPILPNKETYNTTLDPSTSLRFPRHALEASGIITQNHVPDTETLFFQPCSALTPSSSAAAHCRGSANVNLARRHPTSTKQEMEFLDMYKIPNYIMLSTGFATRYIVTLLPLSSFSLYISSYERVCVGFCTLWFSSPEQFHAARVYPCLKDQSDGSTPRAAALMLNQYLKEPGRSIAIS